MLYTQNKRAFSSALLFFMQRQTELIFSSQQGI
jgi:hypothetical protein